MTDFAERLRLIARRQTIPSGGYERMLYGAADEIERLRDALKQSGLYAWQGDTFKVMHITRAALEEKE